MDSRLKKLDPVFLERLPKIFPKGQLNHILKAYLEPKPTTIRVNTLKTTDNVVEAIFKKAGAKLEAEKSIPHCYYIQGMSDKKLKGLDAYKEGLIYLQNLSSQIPPLCLNPKPGDQVLDLCASPGSKTSQMAAIMLNTGKITALEPDNIRFMRLSKNLDSLGVAIAECHNRRAEGFTRHYLESESNALFQKTLADVPCSGDGTIYIHNKQSWGSWSLKDIIQKSKLQKKLLRHAVSMTREKGLILYSTCSISPEENEEVVSSILEENVGIKAIPLREVFPLPYWQPALKSFNQQLFHPDVVNTCRINPSNKTEGFYCALLYVAEL